MNIVPIKAFSHFVSILLTLIKGILIKTLPLQLLLMKFYHTEPFNKRSDITWDVTIYFDHKNKLSNFEYFFMIQINAHQYS